MLLVRTTPLFAFAQAIMSGSDVPFANVLTLYPWLVKEDAISGERFSSIIDLPPNFPPPPLTAADGLAAIAVRGHKRAGKEDWAIGSGHW